MSDRTFLPTLQLNVLAAESLTPGTIAYLACNKVPVLAFATPEGKRMLLDLGGDRALETWKASEVPGSAAALMEWRLECDLGSVTEARNYGLTPGHAFQGDSCAGIVGVNSVNPVLRFPVAVNTAGAVAEIASGTAAVCFSRWRIVTGERENLRTIYEQIEPYAPRRQ